MRWMMSDHGCPPVIRGTGRAGDGAHLAPQFAGALPRYRAAVPVSRERLFRLDRTRGQPWLMRPGIWDSDRELIVG